MNIKSKIIISCLILCLLISVSAVSATDMNDTQYAFENNDLLTIGSLNGNLTVDESSDEIICNENSEILGAGEDSFTNLQTDISASGTTLTLTKDYVFSESDNRIIIDKSNFILNGNGKTIDANGKSSIFQITGNNVTLKNINFKNAYLEDANGAAIYWQGNDGHITDCSFINNSVVSITNTKSFGGAIYWYGKNALIENSVFSNNSAFDHISSGGAIYFSEYSNNIEIINSKFYDNSAADCGGAIFIDNIKVKINNSEFSRSKVNNSGGAIYYLNFKNSVDILNCNFTNYEAITGAAIYGNAINSTVYNCSFSGKNAMFFSSRNDAIINLTNNKELIKYNNAYVVTNNARLYLQGNTFKSPK